MKTTMLNTEPLTPGSCEWCGKDCDPLGTSCSLSCEAQLHRLEAAQGRLVIRTLKKWRKHRGRKGTPGEGTMPEIAAMIDRFNRNDRIRREEAAAKRRAAEQAALREAADKQAAEAQARADAQTKDL